MRTSLACALGRFLQFLLARACAHSCLHTGGYCTRAPRDGGIALLLFSLALALPASLSLSHTHILSLILSFSKSLSLSFSRSRSFSSFLPRSSAPPVSVIISLSSSLSHSHSLYPSLLILSLPFALLLLPPLPLSPSFSLFSPSP